MLGAYARLGAPQSCLPHSAHSTRSCPVTESISSANGASRALVVNVTLCPAGGQRRGVRGFRSDAQAAAVASSPAGPLGSLSLQTRTEETRCHARGSRRRRLAPANVLGRCYMVGECARLQGSLSQLPGKLAPPLAACLAIVHARKGKSPPFKRRVDKSSAEPPNSKEPKHAPETGGLPTRSTLSDPPQLRQLRGPSSHSAAALDNVQAGRRPLHRPPPPKHPHTVPRPRTQYRSTAADWQPASLSHTPPRGV